MDSCCQLEGNASEIKSVKKRLKQLRALGLPFFYQKGQILFYEKHLPCGVFFILKGDVLFIRGPRKQKTRVKNYEGHILGMNHLLSEKPYCSSCEATTDIKGIFFPKNFIKEILKNEEF